MNRFSQEHLSSELLRSEIHKDEMREGEVTAFRLARLAEYDERKLFLEDAFPSMLAWCVRELRLSVEEAKKRIRVARVGRRCPVVFEALANGRVNMSGLVCLATHLTPENAEELAAAAAHKTRAEIEQMLAERFPKQEIAARVDPITLPSQQLGESEGSPGTLPDAVIPDQGDPRAVAARAPNRVSQLSPEAYSVQFTRRREADERFRYAQDLLGSRVKPGDIAEVYDRAIKVLVEKLERARFGACARPRKNGQPPRTGSRHIPNEVKRAVWKRDGGQCTYKSESGLRCEARRDLQFDHEKEFARGGEATVDNLRLRCPGHNQHAAEQTFGAGFMKQKRKEAAAARAAAKAARERARAEKAAEAKRTRLQPHQIEVLPWLHQLGCPKDESRVAVERCRDMSAAPLEERVKCSLTWFGARISRTVSFAPAP